MENGVVVADGIHTLKCYKLLPGMEKAKNLPTYLSMPESKLAEHKIKSVMGGQMGSMCEELTLRLRLVSSKKTQIKELHELINWRQTEQPVLQNTLSKLLLRVKSGEPRQNASRSTRRFDHTPQH